MLQGLGEAARCRGAKLVVERRASWPPGGECWPPASGQLRRGGQHRLGESRTMHGGRSAACPLLIERAPRTRTAPPKPRTLALFNRGLGSLSSRCSGGITPARAQLVASGAGHAPIVRSHPSGLVGATLVLCSIGAGAVGADARAYLATARWHRAQGAEFLRFLSCALSLRSRPSVRRQAFVAFGFKLAGF